MIANLQEYGLGKQGAHHTSPMVSYLGKQTIDMIHILSNKSISQLPPEEITLIQSKPASAKKLLL